jgi:hypothetical protein
MILKVNTDTPSIVHLRCQVQKITTDLPLEDTAGMLVCVLIARFFLFVTIDLTPPRDIEVSVLSQDSE